MNNIKVLKQVKSGRGRGVGIGVARVDSRQFANNIILRTAAERRLGVLV